MITNVYSIYDGKANLFNLPYFALNEGVAMRQFEDLSQDPKSSVYKHKEDYNLYHVASYDDANGEFINVTPIKLIATATQFWNKTMEVPLELMADAITKNGKQKLEA